MERTNVVVVGGGQAGLATSWWLTCHQVDHVVLERGRIGERWRSERWDSLKTLTPGWMSRLPGFSCAGPDPDGYLTKSDVVRSLETWARSFCAPVRTGIAVQRVAADGPGFHIETDHGAWHAGAVVVATGPYQEPIVPALAERLSPRVRQVIPTRYRRPSDLDPGGVLVVGASATGIQLAEELHRSGRPVTLAVGRHTRVPRHYRGHDILWWLDRTGILDELPSCTRHQPSLQLAGRPDSPDLLALQRLGVRLVGRVQDADGERLTLDPDLVGVLSHADDKLVRLLERIDAWIQVTSMPERALPAWRPEPVVAGDPPATLDLHAAGIRSVVWATGFRRSYPWLHVPALDDAGELVHTGGVTTWPGLFAIGLPLQRRRKSTYLDGVGGDARELVPQIVAHLERQAAAA